MLLHHISKFYIGRKVHLRQLVTFDTTMIANQYGEKKELTGLECSVRQRHAQSAFDGLSTAQAQL
jgi:hypothetical protein